MRISRNFNRFYHSLIGELFKKSNNKLWIEDVGYLYVYNLNQLKQALKYLNLDYPRKDYLPLSTRDIGNKKLIEHIEFIFKIAGDNGISFDVIEQEWQRLLNEANQNFTKIS